jgi:glycosyltransferase involved in cell wall biosynthesis
MAVLRRCISAWGLRVFFRGDFDRNLPAVLRELEELEAVVVPSLVEPFGLVLAEALGDPYCKAPVICTNTGGLAEQVVDGHNGLMCEANDPQDLAVAIQRAQHLSSAEREELEYNALGHRRTFNIQESVQRFMLELGC